MKDKLNKIDLLNLAGKDQALALLRDNFAVISYLADFSVDPLIKLLANYARASVVEHAQAMIVEDNKEE